MSPRTWRWPAGVLAGLAVVGLTACGSIPTSGGVGRIDVAEENSDVQSRIDPDGPAPGAGPNEIVRGFLNAGAGYANNFEIARSFLTDSAAGSWAPLSSVTVLPAGTSFDQINSDITVDQQQVSLSIPVQGTVDERGVYRDVTEGTEFDAEFTLRQVNGEWRISQAPTGLVLSSANFLTLFQNYALYFYSPRFNLLVPDTRWFLRSPATATEVMNELLAGPSDYLTGAVITAVPDGTQLTPRSVAVRDGVAVVGLSDPAVGLDEREQALLKLQLDSTLKELSSVTGTEISTPAGPIEPSEPAAAGTTVQVANRPVVIAGDRLGRLSGTSLEVFTDGPDLEGQDASAPALAIDEQSYAYLAADKKELVRLAADDPQAEVVWTGTSLVAPSFDRFGNLWTGETENPGTLEVITADGKNVTVAADFLKGRDIRSVRVARDGTRLAVLSADNDGKVRLEIVGISRSAEGDPNSVANNPPLAVGESFADITDMSWAGQTDLVVLGADAGGSVQPFRVGVSGPVESLGTVPQAARIAAGSDTRTIKVTTRSGEIYSYAWGTWQKLLDVRAVDPAYPG